ncbi:hypothetical protein [Halobaculum limi]|uniref:DUF7847 domain-containing protein n=1 Tax=Halobaculum limi TaxID=3031916 RepID=UPI002406FF6A|nr:hypothetical protein [Halobaculum sp. YSMS11]
MALLSALRRTPSALVRNPVVLVPVLVLSALQTPQLLLQSRAPLLASAISLVLSLLYLVAVPFVHAGLVGMADEALDGHTSLATFVGEGVANFVQVFLVYLAVVAVNLLFGLITIFGVFVAVVSLYPGGGTPSTPVLAGLAILGGGFLLAYVLLAFFVQFYAQAIVIDDCDAVESIRRSASLVSSNLVSVVGYSLVVAVLAGGFGLVGAAASLLSQPNGPAMSVVSGLPTVPPVAIAVVIVVGGTLFGGFLGVFSVSYYRELAG